jgi:hypothetical protein
MKATILTAALLLCAGCEFDGCGHYRNTNLNPMTYTETIGMCKYVCGEDLGMRLDQVEISPSDVGWYVSSCTCKAQ